MKNIKYTIEKDGIILFGFENAPKRQGEHWVFEFGICYLYQDVCPNTSSKYQIVGPKGVYEAIGFITEISYETISDQIKTIKRLALLDDNLWWNDEILDAVTQASSLPPNTPTSDNDEANKCIAGLHSILEAARKNNELIRKNRQLTNDLMARINRVRKKDTKNP